MKGIKIMKDYFDSEKFVEELDVPITKKHVCVVEGYTLTVEHYSYVSFKHIYSNHMHCHERYEICLCLKGEGRFLQGDDVFNISKGTVFVAEPHRFHEIQSSKENELYLFFFGVHIEKKEYKGLKEKKDTFLDGFLRRHYSTVEQCEDLFHYLPLLDREMKKSTLGLNEKILELLVFDVLERLIGETEVDIIPSVNVREIVIHADSYVSQNLSKKISVEDVAKACCVSSRHLQRIMRMHFHQSVGRWILDKKLHAACSQLHNGKSVKEVAEMFGFTDANYFSVAFKKKYGIPPSRYKLL